MGGKLLGDGERRETGEGKGRNVGIIVEEGERRTGGIFFPPPPPERFPCGEGGEFYFILFYFYNTHKTHP